jgi:hypothetical protein
VRTAVQLVVAGIAIQLIVIVITVAVR